MQLILFAVLIAIAFAFIALGYSIDTQIFSTFGFAILFVLASVLMGLTSSDGILIKGGESIVSDFSYNNDTLVSSDVNSVYVYDVYSNFFLGLIMSFVSVIGIVLILLSQRSGGLSDE